MKRLLQLLVRHFDQDYEHFVNVHGGESLGKAVHFPKA